MEASIKRLAVFILTMTVVSLVVTIVGLYSISQINLEQQKKLYQSAAVSRATLIEAIASQGETEQKILSIISKVENSIPETELLIAKYQDQKIICLFSESLGQVKCPQQIQIDGELSQSIHQALKGETGNLIGLDYRGIKVVAGYSFVKSLNWGVVVKGYLKTFPDVFYQEVQQIVIAALSITSIGAFLFFSVTGLSLENRADYLKKDHINSELETEKDFINGILDVTGSLIVVLDTEGRIILFNQVCEISTGYTFAEVKGKRFQDIFLLPEEAAGVNQVFQELNEYNFPNQYRNHWRTKEDNKILIEWYNNSIIGLDGKIKYIVGNGINITEQVFFEEALKESEAQFEAMFDEAVVGMSLLDRQGKVMTSNQQLQAMLSYSAEELSKISWFELTHPEDLKKEYNLYQDILNNRKDSYQIDKRYLKKNGQILWGKSRVSAVYSENRELNFLVAMVEDITTQIELLQDNQGIVKAIGEIVYEHNLREDSIIWKGDCTRILGYSYEEIGKNTQSWLKLVHQEDLSRVTTKFESILNKKSFFDLKYRLRHADGHYLWILDRGVVIYDQQTGQAQKTIGVMFDITAHKQSREAREKLEEEYKRIIETTIEGIWVIDELGRTTFINEMMSQMLGYTLEEIQGKNVADFTDEEGKGLLHIYLKRRAQGIKEHYDFKFIRKDQTDLWVIVATNPIFDPEGKYIGSLKMLTDITERKIAEAALNKANQQLSNLVQQLEQTNRKILLLNKAQESLHLCTKAKEVYEILPQLIQDLFTKCSGGLFMLNSETNVIKLIAQWGENSPVVHHAIYDCCLLRQMRKSQNIFAVNIFRI